MPSRRPKVLCLGVSYADVDGQFARTGRPAESAFLDPTVDAAVACVRGGVLTQMDGRDLARCRSTEKTCNVDVYTVSQEKGASYRTDRHLDANFNRHDFARSVRNAFGSECQFDQIILDYFWIPSGWDVSHWGRSFFEQTLVSFVEEKLLRERKGVIYLPFCLHCFKQIQVCFDALQKHYNISFLRKRELEEVSLWHGTQKIDSAIMQGVLGKHRSQEETYCTFGPKDVGEAMEDPNVSKRELIHLASSLEDFSEIRFLRLEQKRSRDDVSRGRFLGCTDPSRVKRGFDQVPVFSTRVVKSPRRTCKRKLFDSPVETAATVVTPDRTSKGQKRRSSRSLKQQKNKLGQRLSTEPMTPKRQSKHQPGVSSTNHRYPTRGSTDFVVAGPLVSPRLTPSPRRKGSGAKAITQDREATRHSADSAATSCIRTSKTPAVPLEHKYPTRSRTSRRRTSTFGLDHSPIVELHPGLCSSQTSNRKVNYGRSRNEDLRKVTDVAPRAMVDDRDPTKSCSPCTVALLPGLDDTHGKKMLAPTVLFT